MTGRPFGRYFIVDKLGAGGMGEVYRAHDDQLDRDVALKLLPATSLEDATARARLLREARAAAALNHPLICTIHEVGEAEGQAYIAMELVEGVPLSERARRGLPLDEVLAYGTQIADALAHAHARQIVHRDLKCGNVIVSADGRVKVLDFGLAKKMTGPVMSEVTTQAKAGATLTEPGMLVGTLAYMAPEQLRGEPADARSDIWALGVVLYELASGALPFAAPSMFELSSKILNGPPAAFPRNVPLSVRAVVEKCLEKSPARRYQTADEVRAALQAIQGSATPHWSLVRYGFARRRGLAAGLGVLLVAAVVAALNLEQIRVRWLGGAPRVESLAVLPLANLTGDSSQEYFADGMTEVLSTDLARLGGLKRVTARGSVMHYKGTNRPLSEIARELKVDALVTGAVSRSGDRVDITAQLLDPATGDQLWTNRYERDLKDVLVLRNEIVSAIVREIRAHLTAGDQARLAAARPIDPEAFQAYLKGRFEWYKQTRESFDLAEQYFQLALEKDPAYALAYAGLASVWFMRGDTGLLPPRDTFPKASAYMTKALELDAEAPELFVLLANYKVVTEWDWTGAEDAYRRAIEINPNLADAHFFYSDLLLVLKRPDEWQRETERAMELDPLNEFHRVFYGWHLNYRQRYDEAIVVLQKLLPTAPNKASIYLGLWGAYYRKGTFDDALTSAREYFAAAGDRESADLLGTARGEAAYRAAMRRVGDAMVARSAERHVPGIRVARMFAHAGDADRAIQWLERAYENRESPLSRLNVVWDWLDLHPDPRFQDLLRRMKLN
jgi:TolB-like protein/tetratricopeptide (TPR) repeat protein